MNKILLIEDSETYLFALENRIKSLIQNIEILKAKSYQEANTLMREHRSSISVAVVDLSLPDCDVGKSALLTNSNHIPTIILTGMENYKSEELLSKKNIFDYVLKQDANSINFIVEFIQKVIRNNNITALIVDDSKLYRDIYKKDLLKLHINCLEAQDGQEAMEILENPDNNISLILTDYNMPNIDGLKLTYLVREKYNKDELSIIVLSSSEDISTLTKFFKAGANDFLVKPYRFEELDIRINSNLEILELFQKTKDLANRDFLTGAFNRRYFYDSANDIIDKNFRMKKDVFLATLDIDFFKKINDTYGHDVGDIAIKEVIKVLNANLRNSDLLARFGGEEFCILLENITFEDAKKVFEKIRIGFEENSIKIQNHSINYTVSIGIGYGIINSVDKLLKLSDEALYDAKETGRNKVVFYS